MAAALGTSKITLVRERCPVDPISLRGLAGTGHATPGWPNTAADPELSKKSEGSLRYMQGNRR